jgi:hypothetical protein
MMAEHQALIDRLANAKTIEEASAGMSTQQKCEREIYS